MFFHSGIFALTISFIAPVVDHPSCSLVRYQCTHHVFEVGHLLPLNGVRLSADVPISQSAPVPLMAAIDVRAVGIPSAA
jgi:hypothetical protein